MPVLYMLTAVDVRRATGVGSSRANTIRKVALPSLEMPTAEHDPGGGVMAVDFAMPKLSSVAPKFDGSGIDTEIFTGMGVTDRWTFAGAYRAQKPGGGGMVPARAIIEGAVSTWEPDESSPGDFQGCTHTFSSVTHYEFTLDGEELFYVDFHERIFRRNGVDLFEDVRKALGA